MRRIYRLLLMPALFFCTYTLQAQGIADFSMDRTGGCSPLQVSFNNLSSGFSPSATFRWDLGNGHISILRNPGALYTEEKTYTITLTVTEGTKTSVKSKMVTVYKKPVVDFSVPSAKICLPQSAQFTSQSSAGDGSINGYHWDFGDGNTQQSFSNTVTHFYSVEQSPTVSLTVTNSHGCQASRTKTNIIEVLPRIIPAFTANKNMLCTLEDSVKFTNTSTGPGTLQYLWNFGDGNTSTLQNPVHRYSRKGDFRVTLTVSNTDGCSVTSSPLSINAAYFNTDFSTRLLCREATFTSSSYVFTTNTMWIYGDGTPNGFSSPASHVYAAAGNQTVSLINSYGACRDTVTKTIQVQDNVNFNSGITIPSATCVFNNVSFTSTSTTPPSAMTWNLGTGNDFTVYSNPINYNYSQPGTYQVKLTNRFGTCSETVTKNITIHPLPDPKGFIVDYGGVCGSPVTVKFTDTTSGAVSWQWRLHWYGATPFSTAREASFPFVSDGWYTVYLTVTNANGCSQTVSKNVSIYRPNASIYTTYSSSPRGYYDCDSLVLTMAVNSNVPIASFLWNFGNGNTSTLPNPQVKYTQIGNYNISLNYITESGCTGTTHYLAQVKDKPKADFSYQVPCGNSLNLQFFDKSPFSDQWEWSFGDGGFAFYNSPFHLYRDTGKYMARFINHVGHCSDTVVKMVHANVLPSSVQITRADVTCLGTRGTITFDHRSLRASGGTWNFGDGTVIPYDSSKHPVQHTYSSTGTYQVTLTAFYNGCQLTSSRTVHVLLKQSPVLTASATQLCANSTLNVQIRNLAVNPYTGNNQYGQYHVNKFEYNNGNVYNGSFSTWDWNYTQYNATLQNLSAGVSGIRAIVTNPYNGCSDTSNFASVQVNGPITGFKPEANNICYKSAFVFQDTSRSSTNMQLKTWHWDFGDGNTRSLTSGASVQHTYLNPGNYPVRLTVTDAAGCSSSSTQMAYARGPKAAFTASGMFVPTVPLNTSITFYNHTNSWHSNTVNYTWHYGDGATSTSYTGSHTYTQPGNNTVLLIATDPSLPCTDTAKQLITVKDFQTAFSFNTSFVGNTGCLPVMVRINNLSVGFTRLVWDFGDGTTTTTAYYPTHTYYQPGTYRITLKTYGYNGLTGTYVDSVEVKAPSATINADVLNGCIAREVQFDAVTKNTSQYTWDFGDGLVRSGSASMLHQYVTAGVYRPKLLVRDAGGCPVAAALPDSIILDSLFIAIKGVPPLLCDSALVHFTPEVKSFVADQLGKELRYKWDFGTGNPADTDDTKNPSFRFLTPGTYKVRFTVAAENSCVKEDSVTITVHQRANGSIRALNELCQDGTIVFSGDASPSDGVSWKWNFENGNTSSQQHPPTQLYKTPGDYEVSLVVTRNGCIDSSVHILTVHPKPVVNAFPRTQVLCLGDSLSISAQGGGQYLWTPAAGLSNATEAAPRASPRNTTVYHVQVTSDKGCVQNDSVVVTVSHPVDVQLANELDLCRGSVVHLEAKGAASYQWIENTTALSNISIGNPKAAPSATTTYTVVGMDTYKCFADTARVLVQVRDLPTVSAGPDIETEGGLPHQLQTTSSNDVTSWTWKPADQLSCSDCPNPVATLKMETRFTIDVQNTWGCAASDTVLVKLRCAFDKVFIPNAFTPDNDGTNDLFYVKGSGVKIIRYFYIYDRWGKLIFERHNIGIDDRSTGWNGKFRGQPVGTGTYVYLAEVECSSGAISTMKGTVTVIR